MMKDGLKMLGQLVLAIVAGITLGYVLVCILNSL